MPARYSRHTDRTGCKIVRDAPEEEGRELLSKSDGQRRVVIETVRPEADCGRFPIKRVPGETVIVEADVFADGDELLDCLLLYRKQSDAEWSETLLRPLRNDRWRGEFRVSNPGHYSYTVEGCVDRFQAWHHDRVKRIEANQSTENDIRIGAGWIEEAADRAAGEDGARLRAWGKKAWGKKLRSTAADAAAPGMRSFPGRARARRESTALADWDQPHRIRDHAYRVAGRSVAVFRLAATIP